MRIKEEYIVREIAGESIIVNQGIPGVNLTQVISLNSSAKFLFESFYGKDFSEKEVADILMEKYGINPELALRDAESWVKAMIDADIMEKE